MRRHAIALLGTLGVVVALVLGGCADDGGSGTDSSPTVVAAFYPFAFVAEQIAGDHADVVNLTAPGVEPHDLELTPQQVADISEADLVIIEPGFQPAVDEAVEQNAPDRVLSVTDVVELHDTGAPLDHSADDHAEEHLGDVDLEGDPHIWQDPTLMVPIALQLADDLAQIDSDHAKDYRANATALVDQLDQLDKEFQQGMSGCERTTFVTSHAAFGYLAARYSLDMAPIAGLSPDTEPSAEQLAQIQDLIEDDGITTVFSEVLGSQEYAETLANDLDVQAAVLDPIEGLADDDSDDDYFSLMRSNLAALQEANGCS